MLDKNVFLELQDTYGDQTTAAEESTREFNETEIEAYHQGEFDPQTETDFIKLQQFMVQDLLYLACLGKHKIQKGFDGYLSRAFMTQLAELRKKNPQDPRHDFLEYLGLIKKHEKDMAKPIWFARQFLADDEKMTALQEFLDLDKIIAEQESLNSKYINNQQPIDDLKKQQFKKFKKFKRFLRETFSALANNYISVDSKVDIATKRKIEEAALDELGLYDDKKELQYRQAQTELQEKKRLEETDEGASLLKSAMDDIRETALFCQKEYRENSNDPKMHLSILKALRDGIIAVNDKLKHAKEKKLLTTATSQEEFEKTKEKFDRLKTKLDQFYRLTIRKFHDDKPVPLDKLLEFLSKKP